MISDSFFRAEKVRMATDSRLVTIQRELTVCKEQSDKYQTQRDKLAGELRASRETTKTQECDLMMSRGESAKYLAALKDVLYRVQPLAAPPKIEEPKAEPVKENGVTDVKDEKEEEKSEKMETEAESKAEEKVEASTEA